MVHMCKGIISPWRCYVFPDFIFFGLNSAVKRQKKMAQNNKKSSVILHFSGRLHHMIIIFGTHV